MVITRESLSRNTEYIDFPLTDGQQAIWVLHRLNPNHTGHNTGLAARLSVEPSIPALKRAFNRILERHTTLRTTFVEIDGRPVQRVWAHGEPHIEQVDAERLDEENFFHLLEAEAERPFDLERGPLLRVRVYAGPGGRYYLQICIHHIITDEWSYALILYEADRFYRQETGEAVVGLKPLRLSYGEWAEKETSRLNGPRGDTLKNYWRDRLSGDLQPLSLPFAHRCDQECGDLSGQLALKLDPALQQAVTDFSRSIEVPVYATLLAAFLILLGRYAHTDDVVSGFLSANRRPETARMIGYFTNPLLFRMQLDGRLTFADWAKQVQASLLADLAHADFPFLRIAQDLAGGSFEPGRSPWLRALFSWQKTTPLVDNRQVSAFSLNADGSAIQAGGAMLEQVHLTRQCSPFELILLAAETGDELSLVCEYNLDIYSEETVQTLSNHYMNLLRGGLETPQRPIASISTLSADERRLILEDWNFTRRSDYTGTTVLKLIASHAKEKPDATAIVFGEARLTYAELSRRVARLASRLQQAGIGRGAIAAVCMERSPDLVVAALALMQVGAVYLPLDPAHPPERLQFILDDCRAQAVLTNGPVDWLALQSDSGRLVLDVNRDKPYTTKESWAEPTPADLAYVIYTSGSTGKPKGALIAHNSLANLLLAASEELDFGAADILPMVMALSFDGSILEMLLPLAMGAQLILLDVETIADGRRLALALDRYAITAMIFTPSAWRNLLESGWVGRREMKALCGGEALTPDLANELLERTAGVWNLYGPTETTVFSTTWKVKPPGESILESPNTVDSVLIGRPIANTQVYVLDPHLQPVPPGVTGEIYIGGEGLALGYINRTHLTAQRFIPDPFGAKLGGRLYRSGDLGRYLPTGEIEYLGRIDSQVKILGFRIEPAEIEACLTLHPNISAAAVIPYKETRGGIALAGFVVWRHEDHWRAIERTTELRSYLQNKLPISMIPGRFIYVNSLPLTANGKVDRRALLAQKTELQGSAEVSPARNPIEHTLVGIWQEILGFHPVGIHDNFFEIGGHSLSATQIASRVEHHFKIRLPLRLIFEEPTIAELARVIQTKLAVESTAAPWPILPAPRHGPLPVSFSQERMWFIQQMDPDNSAYNVPIAVRVIGKLDPAIVRECMVELIRRHEVLRSTIQATPVGPVLEIASEQKPLFEVIDLRSLPKDEREARLQTLLAADAGRPFDLATGPLIRTLFFRLADEETALLINMHHVVTDAWSIGVLIREFTELYRGAVIGQPVDLPEMQIQYADFARWQRQWFSDAVAEVQLAYWRKQLDGLAPLALPTTRPRPALQTYNGGMVSTRLTFELVEAVYQATRLYQLTPFMVFEAALGVLLQRYTGQDDLAVGMPIANRHWLENENLVGTFVNTLVLRSDLSGDPTFRQLLERTRDTALQAFAYQDYPFERLVAELHPMRDTSLSPLFQVMFNYTDTQAPSLEMEGIRWEPLIFDRCAAQFDLTLTVSKVNEEHILTAEYNLDLFDQSFIQRVVEHYQRLLENGLAAPETLISQLEMLGIEEQQQLADWNNTFAEYNEMRPLQTLFTEQVKRAPDHTALVWKDEHLTFRELNCRANRLARYLQRTGVGAGDCVGVFLERSPEMIVALLAVLKSGAAYVPMDARYPDRRLSFMLSDSQAIALLTQSSLAGRLPATTARVIRVETEQDQIALESDADLDLPAGLDDIAYVIYTSGSTGEPKGVQGLQRGVVNRLNWMWQRFPFEPGEVCCQKTALSFVDSIWEIFGPLLRGVPLVILQDEVIADPKLLVDALEAHAVTRLVLVPSLLRVILEDDTSLDQRLRSLQLWTTSGEKIPAELSRLFFERLPGSTLLNLYGCSEASADSTYHIVDPEDRSTSVPIGRPIANTRIYILDEHKRPVPVGVPGEIYIGGDGLALGYHRRPELTEEKFVTLSVDGYTSERLYRSGDLGRYRPDGVIEYLGRIGTQVKVRGFRIEVEEIEAVLARHDAVKQVLVRALEIGGGQQLVAYIQPKDGLPQDLINTAGLRRFAAEFLPDYMLPVRWVVLERFPTLPNGKVDLAMLPLSDEQRANALIRRATPNWIERRLFRLWEQTLGVQPQSADDSFFDLGGHSLLVINLVQSIENEFGLRLPVAAIFQAETLSEQAALIEANRVDINLSPLVSIQRGGGERPFFCIHGFGGGVADYHELARLLGAERPFYGLQAKGLEGDESPHTTIEEMADYYLCWIRTIQPLGPYALGGYCFGGLVAYEMARQLEAQGERANVVAVFEGYAPLPNGKRIVLTPKHAFNFIQNLVFWLEDLNRLALRERIARLSHRLRMTATMVLHRRRRADLVVHDVLENADRIPERYQKIMNIELRAQFAYQPEPISGRVTLFRVKALSLARAFDPLMGWGSLAHGGVDMRIIEGAHGNIIFKPNVESLARELKEVLEKDEEPGG